MKRKLLSIMLSLAIVVTFMPMQIIDAKEKSKTNVKTKATVSTQTGLKKALKNKKLKTLVVKTNKKRNFVIPKGTHKKVKLYVDAPNSDVKNKAKFKQIIINSIAKDTWQEYAKDNILILNASIGHVVTSKSSNPKEIRIANADGKFTLDVNGQVRKITVNVNSTVDINVDGDIGQVEVKDKSNISISGSSKGQIDVSVLNGADGTMLSSNVKLIVTIESSIVVNFSKGAEGSTIKTNNEEKIVEVSNNTNAAISVENTQGKSNTVKTGENTTIDGKGNKLGEKEEEPTEPTSGGGGSGSGTGGDPTPPVNPPKENIIPDYLEVECFSAERFESIDSFYYVVKNNSAKTVNMQKGVIKCCDKNKNVIEKISVYNSDTGGKWLDPGETHLYFVEVNCEKLKYDRCFADFSKVVPEKEPEVYLSNSIEKNISTNDEGLVVKLTNNSGKQIGSVFVDVLFYNGEKLLGHNALTTNKIYGSGYTDTITFSYPPEADRNSLYKVFVYGAHETDIQTPLTQDIIPNYLNVTTYNQRDDGWTKTKFYVVENKSDKPVNMGNGRVRYYDESSNLMPISGALSTLGNESSNWLQPGRKQVYCASTWADEEYSKVYLDLSNVSPEDISQSSQINKIEKQVVKDDNGLSITLKNTSDKQVGMVGANVLFFDSNGIVYGSGHTEFNTIYGPEYEGINTVTYPIVNDGGFKREKPNSYEVFLYGAEENKDTEVIAEDRIPEYLDVQRLHKKDDNFTYYIIRNNSEKPVDMSNGRVKFYDEKGYVAKNEVPEQYFDSSYYRDSKSNWLNPGQKKLYYVYEEDCERYCLDLSKVLPQDNEIITNQLDKIEMKENSGENGLSIELENTSNMNIGPVNVVVFFLDSAGEVYNISIETVYSLYKPGNKEMLTLQYPIEWMDPKDYKEKTLRPESYQVLILGAENID